MNPKENPQTATKSQISTLMDARTTSTATTSLVAQRRHMATPVPGDDETIEDTAQLVHCLRLLDKGLDDSRPLLPPLSSTKLSSTTHDNRQEDWVQFMEDNPLEEEHLYSLITRMASKFIMEPTKDPDSIRGIVLIGPLMSKDRHRELVRIFHQEFQRSNSLDINILLGLVQLAQDGPPDSLAFDDLAPILKSIGENLKETARQDTNDTIYLTSSFAALLSTLSDYPSKDQSRVEYEPLSRTLSDLQKHKDPLVKFQARYARQILILISSRRTEVDGLEMAQGPHGFYKLLKRPLESCHKKQWFHDIRMAKELAHNNFFSELFRLICKGPSIGNSNFQWHICQLLGEIAVDPTRDDDTRRQSLNLLHEYVKVNGNVKSSRPVIRRWALTILRHIVLPVTIIPAESPNPQAIYSEASMESTPSFVCVLGEKSIKPFELAYPLALRLSMPIASPLLHKVNTDPDTEYAIDRLLRQRSRAYDKRAVYIQLLSKPNIRASEDVLVELRDRAKKFLGNGREVLLVLGDSGAGKSTFGLRLENELWTEYKPGGPIPLFIDLKTVDTPDKDMIHQHLDDVGVFTDQQIESMQRSRQFILICDGYDEYHKWTNLHTKNHFNKPRHWKVKMIVSCRTQYLGPNYREYFEPVTTTVDNSNFSHTSDLFEEAVIISFRNTQIEEYVQLFTQVPKTVEHLSGNPWWSTEQYMERLKSITHLMELAKNPFMLKMIVDVLPTIAKTTTTMTRVELYDRFVELHFESEQRRLKNQHSSGKMDNSTLTVFTSLKDDELIDLGLDFSKQLSHYIFKELDGVNSVTYSTVLDGGSWKDTFFGPDVRAKLLRQSAQLVCRENRQDLRQLIRHRSRPSRKRNSYEFSHRSMLEYFYSCLIFDPRGNTPLLDLATCLDSTDNPLPVINHPLGQTNIVSESSIIDFLAERVQYSQDFSCQLQNIIQLSKAETATSRAAANAITILVQAKTRFNGADLKGIQVPGADLSCGVFDSAQLQGADLRHTILRNVWLHQANLSDSQMEGAAFGEYPYVEVGHYVRQCVFSPDGKRLLVGLRNGIIGMLDTASWSKVFYPSQSSGVSDGQIDLGNKSRKVRLWETEADTFSPKPVVDLERYNSVGFSTNGHYIVSGSEDKTVRRWDAQTGTLVSSWSGHTGDITFVTYSPSGHQIASGSFDTTVRLWDATTGALVHSLSGHSGAIISVAYAPSGHQIATSSRDKTVRLWDVQTGALSLTLSGHTGNVNSVIYSPNGRQIASGSDDMTMRLWDAQTGALLHSLSGHTSVLSSVAFSPSGDQIASGGYDRTVRRWDAQTGVLIASLIGHTHFITSVVYSPSGHQIASSSWDMTVRLWDAQAGALVTSLNFHTQWVYSVAFSPNVHQVVSGGNDDTVRLWDAQTGALITSLSGHAKKVHSVAFSPDGRQIASGSMDKTLRLWDAQTGALVASLTGHTDSVESVAYSPSGHQIASGSMDKTLRLWDAQTGAFVLSLCGHGAYISAVAFSPSGNQIASGSQDKTVRLWDAQTGNLVSSLGDESSDGVICMVYSPSGHQIASGGFDMVVRLWDVQTGALVHYLKGHTRFINSVAYSPSCRWIASGSEDDFVRLWDVDSGDCLAVFGGFLDIVNSITWLDDTYLVTGGNANSVSSWKVSEDRKQVCRQWRSAPDKLVLSNASIQGVHGLSEVNLQLLRQRNAVGQPMIQW